MKPYCWLTDNFYRLPNWRWSQVCLTLSKRGLICRFTRIHLQCKDSFTCIASSLVGQITTTPVPLRGAKWTLYSNSTAGIRNARVFPEPVLAAPRTFFPTRSGGIALAWICICNDTSVIGNVYRIKRRK